MRLSATAAFLLSAALVFGQSPAASVLTPSERAAIETVIKEYLLKNPAVVREALDTLRAQDDAAAAEKTRKTLADEQANLFHDPDTPWIGSANPDVTIVEFFDYRCGFCKKVSQDLLKLVASDPGVRIVLKNYPILGSESVYAARVSLAARSNPKFAALHEAMIGASQFTPESLRKIAAETGLDANLLSAVDSPEITALVDRNTKLGAALGVNATPSFVVGGKVAPGAVSYEELTAMVAAQRAKPAK